MYSQCKGYQISQGKIGIELRFRVCTFKPFYNLIKAGHILVSLPKDGAKVTAEMFS